MYFANCAIRFACELQNKEREGVPYIKMGGRSAGSEFWFYFLNLRCLLHVPSAEVEWQGTRVRRWGPSRCKGGGSLGEMGSECGWGGYKATALPQRVPRLVLEMRRIRQRRPRRATETNRDTSTGRLAPATRSTVLCL